MTSIETIVTTLMSEIDRIVDQKVEEKLPERRGPVSLDDDTRHQIANLQIIANKAYLNKKEAALYIGCSDRAIEEWSARGVKDNPLPAGYAGSDMRIKREKLDEWIEREADRKRLKLAS